MIARLIDDSRHNVGANREPSRLGFSPNWDVDRLIALAHGRGPFFAYDLENVYFSYKCLKSSFPNCDIFYAIKANPHPHIIKGLDSLGAKFEASSIGEVRLALELGVPAQRIALTGPAKGRRHLEFAVISGVTLISVESPEEYSELAEIALTYSKTISVLLRIHAIDNLSPTMRIAQDAREFGAFPSHLGMSIGAASAIAETATDQAPIVGVHLYNSSQNHDISGYKNASTVLAEAAKALGSLVVRHIQWGPGFGVSPDAEQAGASLAEVAGVMNPILSTFTRSGGKLSLEVGRFLVGRAGLYVARVVRVRSVGGHNIAVVEGGVNHFMRPSISTTGKHRIIVLNKLRPEPVKPYSVVGPTGSPIDFFGIDVMLPALSPNDLLCVTCAGAYGRTMSLTGFLSLDEAEEIFL